MPDILDLREDFQDLIMACMLRHPVEFQYVTIAMKYQHFSGVLPMLCARCILDHAKQFNRFPTWEVLRQRLDYETRSMPEAESTGVQDYVNKIKELDTTDWEYVREKISGWLRERALVNTVKKTIEMLKEDKIPPDGYTSMFLEAMQVGQNLDDDGLLLNGNDFRDIDKVVAEVTTAEYGLATGFPEIDRIWKHGWGPGWLVVPAAPPKRYKCLAPNTGVMMYDGSIRLAKDVRVGDRLMGDDSLPRTVSYAGLGRGPMYRVTQASGDAYECNDAHILCLKHSDGHIREVEASTLYRMLSGDVKRSCEHMQGYKANGLRSGKLTLEPIGDGDYYGFTIDGNGRFLLGDFTVTHNTTFCINLAMNVISPSIGEDVIYYACEISQQLAMIRALCNIAGLTEDYLYESSAKFTQAVKEAAQERILGNILFKSFPSKDATIADLRAHARNTAARLGLKPRLIIIDYAETIQPSDKKLVEYRQQSSIYVEARSFAQMMNCTVVMPDRVTRAAVDQPVPDARALQGAFEKAGIVDVAFGLCSTDEEYMQKTIRFFNFLNRHGPAFQHLRGHVDPDKWQITFNEVIDYDPEAARDPSPYGKRASRNKPPKELNDD